MLFRRTHDVNYVIQYTDTISVNENRALKTLDKFTKLENRLLGVFSEDEKECNLKELNDALQNAGISFSNIKRINIV